jgi:hypothetical protein
MRNFKQKIFAGLHFRTILFSCPRIVAPHMARWNDLPMEMTHHILSLFCRDIIEEFDFRIGFWERVWYLFGWPLPPASLLSFSSVLRTCRTFHTAITHAVKYKAKSPAEVLQHLQTGNVSKIMRYAHCIFGVYHIEVQFFVQICGLLLEEPRYGRKPRQHPWGHIFKHHRGF